MSRWWFVAAFFAAEATASAGALGQVVHGVHARTGSSQPPPPSSGPGPKTPPGHVQPPPTGPRPHPGTVVVYPSYPYGWMYWPPPLAAGYYAYAAPYGAVGIYEEGPPPGPPPEPAFFELYLGAQSVQDSDHSLSFDLRFGRAWLALGAHDTSFFERIDELGQTLRLDLWAIGPSFRLLHADASRLWLEIGLAGIRIRPDSFYGGTAGVRVEHDLTDDVALDCLGRAYVVDDVRALELGVGVRWSILRLSWRQVDFDVGPPLRGPELGVALIF